MSQVRWSSKRVLGMIGLILAAVLGVLRENLGLDIPVDFIDQINQWATMLFYAGVGHAITKNGNGGTQ